MQKRVLRALAFKSLGLFHYFTVYFTAYIHISVNYYGLLLSSFEYVSCTHASNSTFTIRIRGNYLLGFIYLQYCVRIYFFLLLCYVMLVFFYLSVRLLLSHLFAVCLFFLVFFINWLNLNFCILKQMQSMLLRDQLRFLTCVSLHFILSLRLVRFVLYI